MLQSGVRILPQHLMGAAARLDQIQAIALRQRALRVHVQIRREEELLATGQQLPSARNFVRLAILTTDAIGRLRQHFATCALLDATRCNAQRWVIAIQTKIQLPNTLPIILNCVIGIIN